MAEKDGIASAKKRALRKSVKQEIEMLFELDCMDAEKRAELIAVGINENEINNQTIFIYSLFKRALSGDVKASKMLLERIEDVPTKDSFDRIFYDFKN